MGIRAFLNQGGHLISFFSEMLNESKWKYSTYDKEFYVIMIPLSYWSNYLLANKFTLYNDDETLRLLNS